MKTACGKCKWHRYQLMWHICVADEPDVFDFLSGEMVKESDALGFPDKAVLCSKKNLGCCLDYLHEVIL